MFLVTLMFRRLEKFDRPIFEGVGGGGWVAYVRRVISGIIRYMHNIYDLSLGCFLNCKQL